MAEHGRLPESCLDSYPHDLLVAVRAGLCRELDQTVASDSKPYEAAHGIVCGKKSRRIAERIYNSAEWVVPTVRPDRAEIRQRRLSKGLQAGPF